MNKDWICSSFSSVHWIEALCYVTSLVPQTNHRQRLAQSHAHSHVQEFHFERGRKRQSERALKGQWKRKWKSDGHVSIKNDVEWYGAASIDSSHGHGDAAPHLHESHSYLWMFISHNIPRRIKKKKNLKGNNENNPEWIKKAHNQSSVNQDVVKMVSGSSLTIKSQNDGEME